MDKRVELLFLYDMLYSKCMEYQAIRSADSDRSRMTYLREQISDLYKLLRSMNPRHPPLEAPD